MSVSKYLKLYMLFTHVGQLPNVQTYALGLSGGGERTSSERQAAKSEDKVATPGGDRRESSTKRSVLYLFRKILHSRVDVRRLLSVKKRNVFR